VGINFGFIAVAARQSYKIIAYYLLPGYDFSAFRDVIAMFAWLYGRPLSKGSCDVECDYLV